MEKKRYEYDAVIHCIPEKAVHILSFPGISERNLAGAG